MGVAGQPASEHVIERTPIAMLLLLCSCSLTAYADPVPVRRSLGTAHAFLTIRTLEGALLATGDLVQVAHGERVTSRLTFHFRDGSLDDETTMFSQHGVLKFVSDRHVQRGPSYPKATDTLVKSDGSVAIRDLSGGGKDETSHLDLPADVSNGMVFSILQNLVPPIAETKVSMVAPTGKGRLVHLSIKPEVGDTFTVGGGPRRTTMYRIHVELGGVTGLVAPLVGKQPEDIRVWVLGGEAPAILRVEGQLYEGGPVWRIEQTAPVWAGLNVGGR